MRKIVAIFLLGLPLSALAQDACTKLSGAIEDSVKEISVQTASGFLETSAIRANDQKAAIGNQLMLIQIHLTMMAAAHCAIPKEPISQTAYLNNALECETAGLKMKIPKAGQKPDRLEQCKRENWVRK
jgi:hypothetical protein